MERDEQTNLVRSVYLCFMEWKEICNEVMEEYNGRQNEEGKDTAQTLYFSIEIISKLNVFT